LFSFNGWADDLICSATDDTWDQWQEIVIEDYKATSGLAYTSKGIVKRGKKIDSDEPPRKHAFERQDRYWWYEYMLYSPINTEGKFYAYDTEKNSIYRYDTCEIKKEN
jgi:hypothetical protein